MVVDMSCYWILECWRYPSRGRKSRQAAIDLGVCDGEGGNAPNVSVGNILHWQANRKTVSNVSDRTETISEDRCPCFYLSSDEWENWMLELASRRLSAGHVPLPSLLLPPPLPSGGSLPAQRWITILLARKHLSRSLNRLIFIRMAPGSWMIINTFLDPCPKILAIPWCGISLRYLCEIRFDCWTSLSPEGGGREGREGRRQWDPGSMDRNPYIPVSICTYSIKHQRCWILKIRLRLLSFISFMFPFVKIIKKRGGGKWKRKTEKRRLMNFDFVCRFQDRNCGRRNARACAARKVESVKPPSCSTAPKPTPESLESARLINEGFNHGPAPESCTRGIDTFFMSVCRWWRKRRWSACAALARPWKRAPSCRRKLLVMLMKDPTRSSCKDG